MGESLYNERAMLFGAWCIQFMAYFLQFFYKGNDRWNFWCLFRRRNTQRSLGRELLHQSDAYLSLLSCMLMVVSLVCMLLAVFDREEESRNRILACKAILITYIILAKTKPLLSIAPKVRNIIRRSTLYISAAICLSILLAYATTGIILYANYENELIWGLPLIPSFAIAILLVRVITATRQGTAVVIEAGCATTVTLLSLLFLLLGLVYSNTALGNVAFFQIAVGLFDNFCGLLQRWWRATLSSTGSTITLERHSESPSLTTSTIASIPPLHARYGRMYPSASLAYFFPIDETAQHDMGLEHDCFQLLEDRYCQSHWPADPENILSIGAGDGRWAEQTAMRFPASNVIATDMHFEGTGGRYSRYIEDANSMPWPRDPESIDYIQARGLTGGIESWSDFSREAMRCLKPGGYLVICDLSLPKGLASDQATQEEPMWLKSSKAISEMGLNLNRPFVDGPSLRHFVEAAGLQVVSDNQVPIGIDCSGPFEAKVVFPVILRRLRSFLPIAYHSVVAAPDGVNFQDQAAIRRLASCNTLRVEREFEYNTGCPRVNFFQIVAKKPIQGTVGGGDK